MVPTGVFPQFSSESPRNGCGSEDLGQEHRRFEKQDHPEQDDSGGQGLCESSFGVHEAP
jgi:hypothetical protein